MDADTAGAMRQSEDIALTNRVGLVITNDTVTMSVATLDLLLALARKQDGRSGMPMYINSTLDRMGS